MILTVLMACTSDNPPVEQEVLSDISGTVTWESVTRLGPHRSALTSTLKSDDENRAESLSIEWRDWDHFRVVRVRDGSLVQDLRVIGGTVWRSTNARTFQRHDEAEIYRSEFASTWNEWARVLEPFAGAFTLEAREETVVEGLAHLLFFCSLLHRPLLLPWILMNSPQRSCRHRLY